MRPLALLLAVFPALLPAQEPTPKPLPHDPYYDKVRGEWLGKLVGGALGMPLEGWNSGDIAGTFGKVSYYLDGYFTERGASGPPAEAARQRIPTDGAWHSVRARLTVPPYATGVVHPTPVFHVTNLSQKTVLECEVRRLNFGSGVIGNWYQVNQGWYFHKASQLGRKVTSPDAIALSLPPKEPDMLRMLPSQTKTLRLPHGRALDLGLEARCTAGEPEAFFSLEYLADRPGTGFMADDDTSWTMIGLLSLEKYGPDLSAKQIAKSWMEFSGQGSADSLLAELLVLHRLRSGIEPPESGNHPIGEAIGGQMRGEIWGLVAPGRPDLAAEYARRDAMVSHRDNGIYGEQFIAAMMAAAFYEKSVPKLIQIGLAHVPAGSKYAEVIRLAVDLHAKYPDFHDALKVLKSRYEALSYVDVFVDSGIVTLALLYGDGDFEKSILIAAACGNDTDCNAANVGALIGCINGAKALPAKWIDPIGDDFRCGVKGHEQWKISELAERICKAGDAVGRFQGGGMKFSTPY